MTSDLITYITWDCVLPLVCPQPVLLVQLLRNNKRHIFRNNSHETIRNMFGLGCSFVLNVMEVFTCG